MSSGNIDKRMAMSVSGDSILQELQSIREEIAEFRRDVIQALTTNDASHLINNKRQQCSVDCTNLEVSTEIESKKQKTAVAETIKKPRRALSRQSKSVTTKPPKNLTKLPDLEKNVIVGKTSKNVIVASDSAVNFSFKLDDNLLGDVDNANKTPLDRPVDVGFKPKHEFLESLFAKSGASVSSQTNTGKITTSKRGRRRTAIN